MEIVNWSPNPPKTTLPVLLAKNGLDPERCLYAVLQSKVFVQAISTQAIRVPSGEIWGTLTERPTHLVVTSVGKLATLSNPNDGRTKCFLEKEVKLDGFTLLIPIFSSFIDLSEADQSGEVYDDRSLTANAILN